jgi:hypothetical protein
VVRVQCDELNTVTQLRLQWSYGLSGEGESDLAFVLPSADSTPFDTVYTAWQLHLQDLFRAYRPDGWRLDTVIVHDLWPGARADVVHDVRLEPIPLDGGVGLAPQLTGLISWRSGTPGRNQRGRMYYGPLYGAESLGENINGFGYLSMFNFGETMQAIFMETAIPPIPRFVVFSRYTDGVRDDPPFYVPITYYDSKFRWATQRRRMTYDWRT